MFPRFEPKVLYCGGRFAPRSFVISFLKVRGVLCVLTFVGNLFHFLAVLGRKDRWDCEVLLRGTVSVFEFLSVLSVSIFRGLGSVAFMYAGTNGQLNKCQSSVSR